MKDKIKQIALQILSVLIVFALWFSIGYLVYDSIQIRKQISEVHQQVDYLTEAEQYEIETIKQISEDTSWIADSQSWVCDNYFYDKDFYNKIVGDVNE